jgi:hypothetical protein
MKKTVPFIITLILTCGFAAFGSAEQTIPAVKVNDPPIIDGNDNDPAWNNAVQIITFDKANGLPIAIKAIYTDKDIFILVQFEDPDESRSHKSWSWNKGLSLYKVGNDREDVFVFKWSMMPEPVDLSIYSDNPYLADIWFWKACRTDPAGFADDKMHKLSSVKTKDETRLTSKSGKTIYLTRSGDAGTSVYKIDLETEFKGETLPRYIYQQPTQSRADVRAKGTWKNNRWTIEFGRALDTGNPDDVRFELDKKYLLGVSRYEIAGRTPNEKLSQPLYGTGDINDVLWLQFSK